MASSDYLIQDFFQTGSKTRSTLSFVIASDGKLVSGIELSGHSFGSLGAGQSVVSGELIDAGKLFVNGTESRVSTLSGSTETESDEITRGMNPRTDFIVNLGNSAGHTLSVDDTVYQQIGGESMACSVSCYIVGAESNTFGTAIGGLGVTYPVMGLYNAGPTSSSSTGPTAGPTAGVTIYTTDGREWGATNVLQVNPTITIASYRAHLKQECTSVNRGGSFEGSYGHPPTGLSFDMGVRSINKLQHYHSYVVSNQNAYGSTFAEYVTGITIYGVSGDGITSHHLSTTGGASGSTGGEFQEFSSGIFGEYYRRENVISTVFEALDDADSINKLRNVGLT